MRNRELSRAAQTDARWPDGKRGVQAQVAILVGVRRVHRPGPRGRAFTCTGLIRRRTAAWSDVPTACLRRTTACERCTK